MKNKNKSEISDKNLATPLDTATQNVVDSDVDGSYTGHPADNGMPIQDADDL